MYNPDLYQKTILFAAKAHQGQELPGTELSYLVHLSNVAMEALTAFAQENTSGIDVNLCMRAALLHDTLEDTAVTFEELTEVFGSDVAFVVKALTKNVKLPKSERMPDSLDRIVKIGKEAAMVKMADRIVNLQCPPEYWSQEKRIAYKKEAQLILDKLGTFHKYLSDRLKQKIQDYQAFC